MFARITLVKTQSIPVFTKTKIEIEHVVNKLTLFVIYYIKNYLYDINYQDNSVVSVKTRVFSCYSS